MPTPEPHLRPPGLDTRRPFRRADALAAGLDPALLRGSRFRRIFRGVYVDASVVTTSRERTAAALLAAPAGSWASHFSAARAYGICVPNHPDEHVCVRRQEDRRSRAGIRFHVDGDDSPRQVGGIDVASPARLFLQLAETLTLVDLVVAGDNMVRLRLVAPSELEAAADRFSGRGACVARQAAGFVRDRVDSPMESRLRLLLALAGLPDPLVNTAVRDENGDVVMRYDLCWPEARLVVEYDGRHHAQRESQWQRDLDRRAAMDAAGWRLIVVTSRGIHADPGATVAAVHAALRERAARGVAARPADGWRLHFPVR